MRERAEAAAEPWHPWGDDSLPERSGMTAWTDDMNGYLGGPWAVHAGSWHPAVALAVADWLAVVAARIEEIHDSLPFTARLTLDSLNVTAANEAVAVARAYLGEPS
jgi:hypothetical protein